MENEKNTGGAIRGAQGQNPAFAPFPDDADFLAVADAWPTLPVALKAGILAMIRAARVEETR